MSLELFLNPSLCRWMFFRSKRSVKVMPQEKGVPGSIVFVNIMATELSLFVSKFGNIKWGKGLVDVTPRLGWTTYIGIVSYVFWCGAFLCGYIMWILMLLFYMFMMWFILHVFMHWVLNVINLMNLILSAQRFRLILQLIQWCQ